MKFSLKGKVAVVTGGGSGIGRAICKNFTRQGAKVFILDLDREGGQQTTDEITADQKEAFFYLCDVSQSQEVEDRIQHILASNTIDILVNNAGVAHVGNIEETKEEDLDRLYRVNIKGVYNCIRSCIKEFKKNNRGVVLNIASVASSVGIADRFSYSMTKGAVLTMTYSIAKDYLKNNIRCNSISPARIHTPFVDGFIKKNYPGKEKEIFESLSQTQPIGRMGTPEEVADLALYVCSDEAAFVTGTDFPIDGGFIKLNG